MDRLRMNNIKTADEIAIERRVEVERLYRQGFKQTEIADRLAITQARVSQIMTEVARRRTNKRRMLRMHPPDTVPA